MDPILPNFKQVKALIVGDIMLDKYWHGSSSRISPEAPVPVVQVNDMELRAGGAANVAINLADLNVDTHLLALVGKDEAAEQLSTLLRSRKIKDHSLATKDNDTITKLRVISKNQQLLRLDFEQKFAPEYQLALLEKFKVELDGKNVVILSDYGKGTLYDPKPYINLAREKNIPVVIDPKLTDYSYYTGATLITPNRKEFESVVGACNSLEAIITKAHQLREQHQIHALLITLGAEGMVLVSDEYPEGLQVSAKAREVFDVTGAGDTVIAMMAIALATNTAMPQALHLANTAAAIVVAKMGTATVSQAELAQAWHGALGFQQAVKSELELLNLIKSAREHGQKIVFTNGCFDIVHLGHVHYLEEAKQLGDILIVAVNSDASVQTLKGPTRPINKLPQRLGILAALKAVDYVVPFNEETPERLIEALLPDVLVKGGDYKVEEIAGSKAVLANGGKVEILSFVPGYSTTSNIDKIQTMNLEAGAKA